MTVTGGVKRVTIDGVEVTIVEYPEFSIAAQKNTTVEVVSGRTGVRAEPVIPFIELKILLDNIHETDLQGKNGVNVQLDLMSGKSYIWVDAAEVSDPSQSSEDGTLDLRYECTPGNAKRL